MVSLDFVGCGRRLARRDDEARSFSQLYLVTPTTTAADTHKRLTTRSGMSPYPLEGPTPPLAEGEFVFLIEAQL